MRARVAAIAALLATLASGAAWAAKPEDGALGFQPSATPMMDRITAFHEILLYIIAAITGFVLLLLAWVLIRYNRRANPTPSKVTHNTLLEVVWTGLPVLILVFISIYSFPLLYYVDSTPKADVTLKVRGYQWSWSYEYPDLGVKEYISNMIPDADIDAAKGELRNLSVDNPLVAPSGKTVRVIVRGEDVIHNWAVPAFGIKMDAIPMRNNETWFQVPAGKEGVYYGQCSELCGRAHAFMPIEVRIVPEPVFQRWSKAMAEGDEERARRVIAAYRDEQNGAARLASAQ